MAGIGKDTGQAQKALESTRRLLAFEYGTCLLYPAYKEYHLELGEVSSYPQGYKENGAVFCHNNPWVSIAEAIAGNNEEAFEVYKRICPSYLEDISDIHRTEPYVYSQMVAGKEAPTPGEAKNSWLTGTAAWTFVNVSQYLLGIRPLPDGLSVNPCLPARIRKARIKRVYRGAVYKIEIMQSDDKGLYVDGKRIEGNIIPPAEKGAVVNVQCKI